MNNMPEKLEINGVTYVRQDKAADTECGRHECSYYKHYLLWWKPETNGPKLEHEAYHEAEKRCSEAQDRLEKWMNDHPDKDPVYAASHLWNQAEMWEHKIAA